nr:hypothetical protein [uncultured Catonella sp.]
MEYVGLSFTTLLTDMFTALFNNVLGPVIRDVAYILISTLGKLIQDALANFLLRGWVVLLKLVHFLQQIFDIFSGYSNIQVKGISDVAVEKNLLEVFLELGSIQRFFLLITMISVLISFITTIIMVARSMQDGILENKNPISAVIRRSLKASFTFMIIPLTLVFMLQVVKYVPSVIDLSFGREQSQSVADTLFITVAEPAANPGVNLKMFSIGQRYEDIELVKSNFNVSKIDYTFAVVSSLLMSLILLLCIFQYIKRLFIIIFLYIISPFAAAYIPVDDGRRFNKWKEMFVGMFLSAYGPMVVMKLYLMLTPLIIGGKYIRFDTGNAMMDVCIKLFVVLGGALAVYRSKSVMLQLFAPETYGLVKGSGSFVRSTIMRAKWKLSRLRR